MRNDIVHAIQRFEKALEGKRPVAWKLLRDVKPLPEDAFQRFQQLFGFRLPDDLRTLYAQMDGYEPDDYAEEKEVHPNLHLLRFVDSLKQFENSDFGPEHNRKEWIILSDLGSKVIFRKLTPDAALDETLYIRSANFDDLGIYDGIGPMLETLATCLEKDAYDSDSPIEEVQIALKFNPNSHYWKDAARIYGLGLT